MDEPEGRPVWLAVLSGVGWYLVEALNFAGLSLMTLYWPWHWNPSAIGRTYRKEQTRA